MNEDFAASMRQAALSTRALKLTEATQIIQKALARQAGVPAAQDDAPAKAPATGSERVDLEGIRNGGPVPQSSRRPRLPLGSVLKALQGFRASKSTKVLADVPVPEGAQFLARSFSSAAGSRPYRIYIPASALDVPRGMIVMLHGCTQNPDDFALGTGMNTIADRHGLVVVYPQQTQASNNLACWNWFRPADQHRGTGEPAILAGLTQEIAGEFGIDRSKTFVAGLSAGGAMAAVLAETYPDLFAAVGIHSGVAYRAATDVVSAFAAMRGERQPQTISPARDISQLVRVIVFHGSADRTVDPKNARQIVASAERRLGLATETRTISRAINGRDCTRTITEDSAGSSVVESWLVEGAGHAWFGGGAAGSYTDVRGPDASAEMVRYFLQ